MTDLDTKQNVRIKLPSPSGIYGLTVPSSNLEESKRFLTDVMCGDLIEDTEERVRVRFNDFTITAEPQVGGVIKPYLEQPHLAFTVTPEAYGGLRQRMHAFGVQTTKAWGRMTKPYALTYFRDPTGNQYELFSPEGTDLEKSYGGRRGGNYVIDFPALSYDRLQEPENGGAELPFTSPSGFNHLTTAVRDLDEARRFLIHVLGGDVFHNEPVHVTAWVGGFAYGVAPQEEGWTLPDCAAPRFTFIVDAEDLLPMKQHIESFGIPTHDICSHDGVDAWMYFRDPSGNMLELLCPEGFKGETRRDLDVDILDLLYDTWNDPVPA